MTERGSRFVLGLMTVLAILAVYVARPFLSYVLLGLIFAFLLRGWFARLVALTKRPRLAASLLVATTVAFLVLPFVLMAIAVTDEVMRLASMFSDGSLQTRIQNLAAASRLPRRIVERGLQSLVQGLESAASSYARSALPTLFEFFIGLFVLFFVQFYAMLQGKEIVDFVRSSVPLRNERMDRLLGESGRAIDAVFKGEILVALIQGVVAGIGWWLFGYPSPLLWGFVMTVLSIIPWTGAPLVIVPAGIWTALQGDVARGIGFIVFGMALVGSIDNVLRPFLIGRSGGIHPAIVLVGVVGGLVAFGIVGIFIGPLILTLLRAAVIVWREGAPPPTPAR